MGLLRLLFLDESAVWLTQPNTYTWAAIGQPMAVPASKARGITARLNLMGAVDFASGEIHYREIEGNTTGQDTVDFLETLAQRADPICPTLVIVDQASIHTCRAVSGQREHWRERGLMVVYLPVYSPELNPMEGKWRVLKYHELPGRFYETKPQLRQAVLNAGWGIAI
ncbi:IS630 family transposase [Deinococcus frigens]|uniref:IS630 family transposase n=1 Tax=Deinococcus frigens TaxID=249403 RepID=UPI0005540E36|nr:IS630 family transposase [Deinococcus frigens]